MPMSGALCDACGAVWRVNATFCGACGASEQARVEVSGHVLATPADTRAVPTDPEVTIGRGDLDVRPSATAQVAGRSGPVATGDLQDLFAQRVPHPLPRPPQGQPGVPAIRTVSGAGSFGFPVAIPAGQREVSPLTLLPTEDNSERRRTMAIAISTIGVLLGLMWLVAGGPRVLLLLVLAGLVLGVAVELVVGDRKARTRRDAIARRVRSGIYLGIPHDAAAGLVVQQLAASGAAVSTYTASLITGTVTVKRRPNILLAVLLWLVCIVPMIIYVVSASKDVAETYSIRLEPSGEGVLVFPMGEGEALERVSEAVVSVATFRPGMAR